MSEHSRFFWHISKNGINPHQKQHPCKMRGNHWVDQKINPKAYFLFEKYFQCCYSNCSNNLNQWCTEERGGFQQYWGTHWKENLRAIANILPKDRIHHLNSKPKNWDSVLMAGLRLLQSNLPCIFFLAQCSHRSVDIAPWFSWNFEIKFLTTTVVR